MSLETAFLWIGFASVIAVAMSFDLFVLQRRARAVPLNVAILWSIGWITLGLLFGGVIFVFRGHQDGLEYLTGYLIEKSLSVDNIFIFLLIFQYFDVPDSLQPKALRWGILGALVLRFIFILSGAALLNAFDWMIFVFGAILLFAALRLATQKERQVNPERNPVLRVFRRFVPMTADFEGERFMVSINGRLMVTPLLMVILVIETTDVVFALDSIPAILAITRDPFIVYTSNAFAILGLRALYFVLADVVGRFAYLRQGLVAVLAFVGVKMMISEAYEIPTAVSLVVIVAILSASIVVSQFARREISTEQEASVQTPPPPAQRPRGER